MQYSLEALIDTELLYALKWVIEPTGPESYSVETLTLANGKKQTFVKVKYVNATDKPNQREKVQKDLVKQVNSFGGYVQRHECNHDASLPCVFEDIVDVKKVGGSYGAIPFIRVVSRTLKEGS